MPGEDRVEWEAFHAGVVADLCPVGVPEAELANRIASLMWRRRRVVAFEVAVATCPPDADSNQPPRLGGADPHQLKVRRRRLADCECVLADARRRQALVTRLALAGDDERVPPGDAVFLPGQATDVVAADGVGEPVTTDAVAVGAADAGRDESDVRPQDLLTAVDVPDEFHEDPRRWDGWTVGGADRAGVAGR